jgi:hypothetical protein
MVISSEPSRESDGLEPVSLLQALRVFEDMLYAAQHALDCCPYFLAVEARIWLIIGRLIGG